ncbi:AEC family transporter [Endozoicomonas ascidiicola]|uniref:AEC family transporter n=1 Tax=Endozoicomonas ascidiicola TaxID=1698521 RepID=UPI00083318F0|nr:AEC family transporter [Endozoicomonas ascidiicola]
MFWETLLFTASVTLPVCAMLLAGIALKRFQFIDDHFVTTASRLVFNFCMPALLFTSIINLDMASVLDFRMVIYAVIASIVTFLTARILAAQACTSSADYGAFIQGAARANLAIVGMALAGNIYGSHGIALMSLALAFLVPLYNVLSVFVLAYYASDKNDVPFSWKKLIIDLTKNPLIASIVVGFCFVSLGLQLPAVAEKVSLYFAQITLPLALISIGGSLSMDVLRKTSKSAVWATLHKVCLMPVMTVLVAWLLGLRGIDLGIIFLIFACPTAAASFVMTKAMGGNDKLAANIVVLTTLGSLPATAIGIFTLRYCNLI